MSKAMSLHYTLQHNAKSAEAAAQTSTLVDETADQGLATDDNDLQFMQFDDYLIK